ncbi:hypothetical protein GWK47_009754 [Chionoecetes opilio]|uniref:Uncharacterized protein n=1 Tax=Chionoecetes opilio TaxID=41210 RepID=A0A8J5C3Q2_CHIOP|nr:hypothetical protein GWK47_009754 [Chionoecetes opilio]
METLATWTRLWSSLPLNTGGNYGTFSLAHLPTFSMPGLSKSHTPKERGDGRLMGLRGRFRKSEKVATMTSGTETKQGKMDRRKSTVNPQKDPQAAMEEVSKSESSTTLVNVCLSCPGLPSTCGQAHLQPELYQEKGKVTQKKRKKGKVAERAKESTRLLPEIPT